nr:Mediator of U snRNA nuclear export PHAX [Ipomoea batatas]
MEIGYGIPNGLHENIEDGKDIKMSEFEEGELVEMISKTELGESSAVVSKVESQETRAGTEDVFDKDSGSKNKNRRKNRKKKRKNKGNNGTFVTNVCKRLKEKKSYLVWNAVACLGVSALSDLVKEVEAIQACGGQKTADGRRFRVGGGILWKVIRAREPNAYKDIMKRGKEFEVGHRLKKYCILLPSLAMSVWLIDCFIVEMNMHVHSCLFFLHKTS